MSPIKNWVTLYTQCCQATWEQSRVKQIKRMFPLCSTFSTSEFCLPLSFVLLSICFLQLSSCLPQKVVLGLTPVSQGCAGWSVWVALCSLCPLSFLLTLTAPLPWLLQHSEMKMNWEVSSEYVTEAGASSLWPLSCCKSPSRHCCVQRQRKQLGL